MCKHMELRMIHMLRHYLSVVWIVASLNFDLEVTGPVSAEGTRNSVAGYELLRCDVFDKGHSEGGILSVSAYSKKLSSGYI